MNGPGTIRVGLSAVAACGVLVIGLPAAQMARSEPPGRDTAALWREDFDHAPPDFVDPAHHDAAAVAQAYAVRVVDGNSVLHARHDGTRGTTPAIHYGRAFERDPPALDGVSALRWRWRVLRHPDVDRDPWADVAASLYVLMRAPSVLHGGRGFKFGWIARPGAENTYQRGILQVALRAGGPLGEWHAESIDLCALFRRTFGPCEGEHVLYVGVMTDADATHSVAEAEYDEFALLGVPALSR